MEMSPIHALYTNWPAYSEAGSSLIKSSEKSLTLPDSVKIQYFMDNK